MKLTADYRCLPLVLAILATPCAFPQLPAGLKFDVVSIRPASTDGIGGTFVSGGSVSLSGVTMAELIRMAFDLHGFQVSGGPAWVSSERFEVMARTDRKVSAEERNEMLQAMLADRFRLVVHRETKTLAGYVLTVGKGGPKFREAKFTGAPVPESVRLVAVRRLEARQASIADFIKLLNRSVLREPVIDKTGLVGRYDFQMAWGSDTLTPGKSSDPTLRPFFQAIPQQLGLKLVAAKVPVEVVAIDEVHMPTPN